MSSDWQASLAVHLILVLFDQVAKDVKAMFTFEKQPLVAELKVKISKI